MLVAEGKVRQFDAVLNSTAKIAQLNLIYADKSYVGEVGVVDPAGGTWQRTAAGTPMKVSIAAKLLTLALNKFAILDPLSMGVEMEAGKPGWNDAMNGLPALFGSEMPAGPPVTAALAPRSASSAVVNASAFERLRWRMRCSARASITAASRRCCASARAASAKAAMHSCTLTREKSASTPRYAIGAWPSPVACT